jgi:hypothetical protein
LSEGPRLSELFAVIDEAKERLEEGTLSGDCWSTIHPSAWKGSSRKLLALAHPPGLLRCRRFPTHPECLNHRSNTPNEHEDRQDER